MLLRSQLNIPYFINTISSIWKKCDESLFINLLDTRPMSGKLILSWSNFKGFGLRVSFSGNGLISIIGRALKIFKLVYLSGI